MRIVFSDIVPGGTRRIIKDGGWASTAGVAFYREPEADLSFLLIDDTTVALTGDLQATIKNQCSRCGCVASYVVNERFEYTFRLEKDGTHGLEDVECKDEDIETVYLDKPEISIDEILLEQLILSIPEKLLCSKQCKGICPGCGVLLNDERCSCDENSSDSPFAVLKNLKK